MLAERKCVRAACTRLPFLTSPDRKQPGSPLTAKAAEGGDAHAFSFCRPRWLVSMILAFRALGTAVLRQTQALCDYIHDFPFTQRTGLLTASQRNNIAASLWCVAVFCTNNAAMVAALAHYRAQQVKPGDPYKIEVVPNLSM